MTTFANPLLCPSCGLRATGEVRCARCGIELTGTLARELLAVLTRADAILTELRVDASAPARSIPATDLPRYPRTSHPSRRPVRRPRWTTGTLLLALGALCLVVAAVVFVSVSWGDLGLPARTAILVAITTGVGFGAVLVTRRRLAASAEALWTITGSLATLNFAAARAYGLLGLSRLDADLATVLFGSTMLVASVAVTWWARPLLRRPLWSGQAGAALGSYATALCGGAILPVPPFWALVVATVVAAGLTVALGSIGLRAAGWAVGALTVGLYAAASAVAVFDYLVDSSPQQLVLDGRAGPSVLLATMVAAVGVGSRLRAPRRQGVVIASSAVAAGQLTAIAYAGVASLDRVGSTVGVSVIAVALMAVSVVAVGAWGTGLRLVAVLSTVPVIALALTWLWVAGSTVVSGVWPMWSESVAARLAAPVGAPGPMWLASVVLGASAIGLVAAGLWREAPASTRLRPRLHEAAAVGIGLAAAVQLALLETPVLAVAAAAVVLAALSCGYGLVRRIGVGEWIGLAGFAVASVLPVATEVGSLIVWSIVLIGVVAVATLSRSLVTQVTAATMSAVWVFAVTLTAADLAGTSDRGLHLVLVVATCVLALAAQLLASAPSRRVAVECVAGVGIPVAVVVGLGEAVGWQAAMLSALGATVSAIALLRADRRFVAPAGAVLLASAYVLELVAADVRLVEAYTLPFALLVLAAGLLRMRRDPRVRTAVALLPGLGLALLPSLPQVLHDPTTLRGLLLGLGALTAVAVGIARTWQAPFLAGTAVSAVIALRHVGPYADAVPRWVLLAAAGVALLGAGITWEARIRDARSAAMYVRSMR